MKTTWRKVIALVLAGTMIFGIASCSSGKPEQNQGENTAAGDGKLFAENTEIDIVIGSHPSWPYDENWPLWKYFQEETGATFKIRAVPFDDLGTKISLMLASPDTLPDLLHATAKSLVDAHFSSGAFISISDNLDKMPYYAKFMETLPETEREELVSQRKCADGKIYSPPVYGTGTVNNMYTWLYRKDILDKHQLTAPTTMDELYQVSKKLKELYPSSYPLCLRNAITRFDVIGCEWNPYFQLGVYYDFNAEQWKYGAVEDTAKQIVEYFIKMYEEGLVPPDYITLETKQWEELMSTDRGFITNDFIVRVDFFNKINRVSNPQYNLTLMQPPKATAEGVAKVSKTNVDVSGYYVCNTGDQKRIDNAMKLLDWMYSDHAFEVLNWGRENETYRVVDGKREFILTGDESPNTKYGAGTFGLCQRTDPESNEAIYTEEQRAQSKIAYTNTEDHANPTLWLSFTDDEAAKVSDLGVALNTFLFEQISRFLLKQRPLSEWDSFVAEAKRMNIDELLNIYDTAYKRALNK